MNQVSMVISRLNPWMDLEAAADYSGLPFAELAAAATKGLLPVTRNHPRRPGDAMVRMDDIDLWVGARTGLRAGWATDGAA